MVRLELVDRIIKIPANKEVLVMHDDNPEEFLIRISRALLTYDIEQSTVFLLTQLNDNEPRIEVLEPYYGEDDWIDYIWKVKKQYTAMEGYLTIQLKIVRDIEPAPEPPTEEINCNIICKYVGNGANESKILEITDEEGKEIFSDSLEPEVTEQKINITKPGNYKILTLAPGYVNVEKTVAIKENQTEDVEIEITFSEAILPPVVDPEDPGEVILPPVVESTNYTTRNADSDETEPEEPEEPTGTPAGNDDPWEDVDPGILFPIGENTTGVWYSYQNKFKITKALDVLL